MKYDIVVVGAGPAGSSAAQEVLLLEKRQEIGSPVRCAGGVGKAGLEKCGIKPDPKWIACEMKGAKLHSPNDTVVELSEKFAGNEVGYVLERKLFDRELAARAAEAGAEIMVKSMATSLIKRDGKIKGIRILSDGQEIEIEADLIIAADGVESKVARWAGIDTSLKLQEIESCVQYLMVGVECEPDYTHFYIGSCYSPGGYIWVFPKGGTKANIGIGVLGSKIPKRSRGFAKKLLDQFLEKHPQYSKGKRLEVIGGGVPVSSPLERSTTDNLMVVGDAARHADPATGGGIINGIRGAKLAGEIGAEAVEEQNFSQRFLSKYERAWRKDFGKSIEKSLLIKEILINLEDSSFDGLADSLVGYKFEELGLWGIIEALEEKHPELLGVLESISEG
jgi:digeranylgeranylglycerophospholipid reductase